MPAKLRKIWQTAAIAHCKNAAPAYAHASSGPSAKGRAAAIAAGHGWRHVQAVAHIDATLAPRPQFTMPSGSTRHDAALHNTANTLALNALQYGPF